MKAPKSLNEIIIEKQNLNEEEKKALREAIKNGSTFVAVGAELVNSKGNIIAHRYILRHKHLSASAKLVFETINFFCFVKDDNKCQTTQEILSDETGCSLSTIKRAIKELKGINYINENGEKVHEVFLKVIRMGYMQPDTYMIYYKNIKKSA